MMGEHEKQRVEMERAWADYCLQFEVKRADQRVARKAFNAGWRAARALSPGAAT